MQIPCDDDAGLGDFVEDDLNERLQSYDGMSFTVKRCKYCPVIEHL